jgi:hypothetical protein
MGVGDGVVVFILVVVVVALVEEILVQVGGLVAYHRSSLRDR